MNMKKPEMKVMRFVNEDVIATSGADFVLSGFFDGQADNLTTIVNGTACNGQDELNAAFKGKWGGENYSSIYLIFPNGSGDFASGSYLLSDLHNGTGYDRGYDPNQNRANGIYTYERSSGATIQFKWISPITQ